MNNQPSLIQRAFIVFAFVVGLLGPAMAPVLAQDATPSAAAATPVAESTIQPTTAPTETATAEASPSPTQTEAAPTVPPPASTSGPKATVAVRPSRTSTSVPAKRPADSFHASTLAAPALTLSRGDGYVNSSIVATLSGFAASSAVALRWDGAALGTATTDASGAASITFRVPDAVGGSHAIAGTVKTATKSAAFRVKPRLVITPAAGAVGTQVKVSLSGFGRSERVEVRWTSGALLTAVTVSTLGSGSAKITIPKVAAGLYKVTAKGTTGATADVTVTVVSPTPAPTKTATAAPTKTPDSSPTATKSPSPTATATKTPTGTATATPTKTPTATATSTAIPTATATKTATPSATATMTPTPAPTQTPGSLVILKQGDGGAALAGACFRVYRSIDGIRGESVAGRCDADDTADGTTTFAALPPGAMIVVEVGVPAGYLPAASQTVTIAGGSAQRMTFVDAVNTGVVAADVDELGAPLPSSCFQIFSDIGGGNLGSLIQSGCDDTDASDGVIHFAPLAAGSYVLVQKVVPRGYARATRQRFTVAAPAPLTLTVQNQPGGAILVAKVNEQGGPIKGSCFDAYTNLGGGALGSFVDRSCNADGNQVMIDGLPVGNYYLVESTAPEGYLFATNKTFSIVAKRDISMTVVDLPNTKVVIRKQNVGGQALRSACFTVFTSAGGARGTQVGVEVCDGASGEDGYTTIPLSVGSYILVESKTPVGYLFAADTAFSIRTGLDTALDVVDQLGGTIVITKTDSERSWWIPGGACFTVWTSGGDGQYAGKLGSACDSDNNGETTIVGIPTGLWVLQENKAPIGYFDGIDHTVNVTVAQTTSITIPNDPWPLLAIHKTDAAGADLGGACWEIYADLGGGQRGARATGSNGGVFCDTDNDSHVQVLVTPGNQILVEKSSPLGYLPIEDRLFTMVRGRETDLNIVDVKVGIITITKTDLEGKPLTDACFSAYANLNGTRGALVASGCDRVFGDGTWNPTRDGVTVLNGLRPGSYLVAETTPPSGYYPAADTPVQVAADDNPVTIMDEPWSKLVITKVDDQNTILKTACFQVYKVGTSGGRGSPVGIPNCGDKLKETTQFGVAAGSYLLAESTAPAGYLTAADMPLTIARGVNREVTMVDYPSGAIAVTVVGVPDTKPVSACWELWTVDLERKGVKAAAKCADSVSVTTTLAVAPGSYFLVESKAPDGYIAAADQRVTITARATLALSVANVPYPKLVIIKVDEANKPLNGACFALYQDVGTVAFGPQVVTGLCDSPDAAKQDASTEKRLKPGRYIAQETVAPKNYAIAPAFKFTIFDNTDVTITLQDQLAGTLTIATRDRALLALNGACYELWTKTSDGQKGVLVTKRCDSGSTTTGDGIVDGYTKFVALVPSVYIVSESFPPTGYLRAEDRSVTIVGQVDTSISITNDKP